jgi:diaminohydroxyphosphoribosylaminopyrimidine deaminase / 5-amino-6-(5-phosphoribosylamino)uracil reductase
VSRVAQVPGIASHAELVWLARARALAQRARGRTSPNPLVGAIVAREGRVVGEGWHEGPGTPHAEVVALQAAGERALGATLVVTLEPCSHHGRTPPCTDAILRAGVARVVIGCADPLEAGRGRGSRILAAAGLSVVEAHGPEGEACRELNAGFLTWAVTGRPSVTLKLATSLDGKVATAAGESQWISGQEARALVHRWRADSDAVAVGIGTALADDPRLTARDLPGPVRQPLRVVFDSDARLPIDSKLARGVQEAPVLVVAGPGAPPGRVGALRAMGVEVLQLESDEPAGAIAAALAELGRRDVQSLMVEGGARLAAAFVGAGAVDRVTWVLAPILLGGAEAPGALADVVAPRLQGAPRLVGVEVMRVGEDLVLTGRLKPLPAPPA